MLEAMTVPDSAAPEVAPNFITEIIERDLESGKYPQVVTRFPPEPSGYAHLGHVFASFLDFQTAAQFGGRYHLRMDDTNPELATQEYVDAIADDLRWLGWDWGDNFYYASDNFERYYEFAEQLIRQGDAYVDSVSPAEMAALRGTPDQPGTPSPYRNRTVEENLDLFRRMRTGEFANGEHLLRAKIDLSSPNMKLRDPALYRILHAEHYRAGGWCIYPMYDFQHPIQDALEGVTHSMCSLEFVDNRAIYDWLMERLGFDPRPHQYEFGRRGLEYTVTSKRKLRRLIEEGAVSGWDDPRMPTLRAQRRLGVTPEAVRNFAAQIGVNRTNRTVDIAVYENAVRDDLNTRAPRVMAVLDPLKVVLTNLEEPQTLRLPYWPHDVEALSPDGLLSLPSGERVPAAQAVRPVPLTREVYIERGDFALNPPKGFKRLTEGGTVRLRGAGIIRADEVELDEAGELLRILASLQPEEVGAAGVIHWVSAEQGVPAEFRLYDRLFRVPNPEGENVEDLESPLDPPAFDPEGMSHEGDEPAAPGKNDFTRFLNPHSLTVRRGFVEPSVLADPQETRYQFERQGYFWRDPVDSREDALVFGRITTLKDSWGKGQAAGTGGEKAAAKSPKAPKAQAAAPEFTPAETAEIERLRGLGVGHEDAITLARDEVLAEAFREAQAGSHAAQVAAWVVNDLAGQLREGQSRLNPADLPALAELLAGGSISTRIAKDVLTRAAASGEAPAGLVEREGLRVVSDGAELRRIIREVLAAHPAEAEAFRGGKAALQGFFMGQVMRATSGQADPKALGALLREMAEEG